MLLMNLDNGKQVVFIEGPDLDALNGGAGVAHPEVPLALCPCPDPQWVADELQKCNGNIKAISKVLADAPKRPRKDWARPTTRYEEVGPAAPSDNPPHTN